MLQCQMYTPAPSAELYDEIVSITELEVVAESRKPFASFFADLRLHRYERSIEPRSMLMETINQPISAQTTSEQRSGAPQRKGGFVQGAAVAQGCCGETCSSSGCCGAPAQASVPVAAAQGCCAETGTNGGCCS